MTICGDFDGIGAPVDMFAVGGAVGRSNFAGGRGIGHDQPVAGRAGTADVLAVAFAVVVNELPVIFDAIASAFVVLAVVEDLILLLAGIDCGFGSEWHAFVLGGVESLIGIQTSSSSANE